MIGGNSRVNLDTPPYFLYHGFDASPVGINIVGLRRAGFTHERVQAIKRAYQLLYGAGLKLSEALDRIEGEIATPEAIHIAGFARASKRGICRPRNQWKNADS